MAILPSLDTTYPVLIFKQSRGAIHHGALGIARSLGRLGVPVYAIVGDGFTPLAASRYLTRTFVWESWPCDGESFLSAMLTIGEIINRPTILVPLDDWSAIFVAENLTPLSRWFLFSHLPSAIPRQLANKASFHSLCANVGLPSARTVAACSLEDISEFIKCVGFPVVVKAIDQWDLLDDKYNVMMMHTREDLFRVFETNKCQERPRMILQEYVPGEDWIYHGYCNSTTELCLSFTGRKLLSYPAGAGSTALGLSVSNDALRGLSEKFLRAISYSGIIDIDFRKDARDGKYKILDCNPRVGQNFRMFENIGETDVIIAQHLDLSGRSVDCRQMSEGRLFVAEQFCLLAFLRRERRSAPRADLFSRRRHERVELAWWSRDDPLPFFVMSLRLFGQAMTRAFRRIWN